MIGTDSAQVDALVQRGLQQRCLTVPDRHAQGIEEAIAVAGAVAGGEACCLQTPREPQRVLVHALGNRPQALWTVEDGVEGSHDREQGLRGADVRGRLLPADVLLPGL